MRLLGALFALIFLTAAHDPILVPAVSPHEVQVHQGFTGAELLLFGAILDPAGRRAGQDYDIVVVLKGPTQSIRLREKRKIAGIWINADSSNFRSAPSFYALASSRPVHELVDERTAAIYELGLDRLQLSPGGEIDLAEQARFTTGLVDLKLRQELFAENPTGVSLDEQVLYQARISLPSSVTTGTYTAETFAITKGRVIASATSEIEVRKLGFGRLIEIFAEEHSLYYGLLAVVVSVAMGVLAGRLLAFG